MNRDDKIDQLTNLAQEMRNKQKEIEALERQLEQAKSQYDNLSSKEIPFIMSDLGMKSFTLDDGTFFAVSPVLRVNYYKDRIEAIDNWLTNNGHGGMVKTNIDISLPKASGRLPEIQKVLNDMGIVYGVNKTINWQTLNKWGREMDEEGMVIPEELFSVYRSNKTVIGE